MKILALMLKIIPPHQTGWTELITTQRGRLIVDPPRQMAGMKARSGWDHSTFDSILNYDDSSYHQYWWYWMRADIRHPVRPLGDDSYNNQHKRGCMIDGAFLIIRFDQAEKWVIDHPGSAVRSPVPSIINIDDRRDNSFLLSSILMIEMDFILLSILIIGEKQLHSYYHQYQW